MQFIDIPTEQTTAITDFILFLVSVIVVIKIYITGKSIDLKKTLIWSWAFGLLALAAFLGSIAHGFSMSTKINYIFWQPLNLSLGLAISMFVAGVIYDWKGFFLPQYVIPILLTLGLIFYIITIFVPGGFFLFILYEGLAMLLALTLYFILWFRKKIPGSGIMAIGILVTILAAIIQSIDSIHFRIIWEFDHNGLFHIIQLFGLTFLVKGIMIDIQSREQMETIG